MSFTNSKNISIGIFFFWGGVRGIFRLAGGRGMPATFKTCTFETFRANKLKMIWWLNTHYKRLYKIDRKLFSEIWNIYQDYKTVCICFIQVSANTIYMYKYRLKQQNVQGNKVSTVLLRKDLFCLVTLCKL